MWTLSVDAPGEEPRRMPLDRPVLTIGRASLNDLALSDKMLSRRHARIVHDSGGYTFEDLGSRNGSYVNGERLYSPRRLEPGDRITIGSCTLVLRRDQTSHVSIDPSDTQVPHDSTVFKADSTLLRSHTPRTDPNLPGTQMARLVDSLRLVNEMTMKLLRNVSSEEMLESLMSSLFEALRPDRGAVLLKRGDRLETALVRTATGRPGEEIRLSQTLVSAVVENRQALLVVDADQGNGVASADSIKISGIKSILAAPLENEGEVVGLIYLDARLGARSFTEEDLRLVTSLANVAAAKIQNVRLAQEAAGKKRMENDIYLAREIQQKLLPDEPLDLPGFELFGTNVPSREVSGDYYDYRLRPDGRAYVVIADVCGKGVGPALLMASLQATFAAWADDSMALPEMATRLSQALAARTAEGRFVTAVLALLDPATGRVEYVNAGHNPPILLRGSGEIELLKAHGRPLALFPQPYASSTVELVSGELIFMYTDGITEANNPEEEEFGLDRLKNFVAASRDRKPEEMDTSLIQELSQFARDVPFADDRTWVLVRRR